MNYNTKKGGAQLTIISDDLMSPDAERPMNHVFTLVVVWKRVLCENEAFDSHLGTVFDFVCVRWARSIAV